MRVIGCVTNANVQQSKGQGGVDLPKGGTMKRFRWTPDAASTRDIVLKLQDETDLRSPKIVTTVRAGSPARCARGGCARVRCICPRLCTRSFQCAASLPWVRGCVVVRHVQPSYLSWRCPDDCGRPRRDTGSIADHSVVAAVRGVRSAAGSGGPALALSSPCRLAVPCPREVCVRRSCPTGLWHRFCLLVIAET